jgi:hypothetical protein
VLKWSVEVTITKSGYIWSLRKGSTRSFGQCIGVCFALFDNDNSSSAC